MSLVLACPSFGVVITVRSPLSRATSTRLLALLQAIVLLTSVVVPSAVLAQAGDDPVAASARPAAESAEPTIAPRPTPVATAAATPEPTAARSQSAKPKPAADVDPTPEPTKTPAPQDSPTPSPVSTPVSTLEDAPAPPGQPAQDRSPSETVGSPAPSLPPAPSDAPAASSPPDVIAVPASEAPAPSPSPAASAAPSPLPGDSAAPSPGASPQPAPSSPDPTIGVPRLLDIAPAIAAVDLIVAADPASLAEPGGVASVIVSLTNISSNPAVLSALSDDALGDLDGIGDCVTGGVLAAGQVYGCSYQAPFAGPAGAVVSRLVSAELTDQDDGTTATSSGSASVTITDTPSAMRLSKTADPSELSEPGGPVTFSLVIDNDSAVDSITLDSLVDAPFGDVTALPGDCAVPQTIVAGASYSCSFSAQVSGNAGDTVSDTVTASATDDDGNALSETAGASVDITDSPSAISVTKSADPSQLPEPGGPVTFSLTIDNDSAVDSITLESLVDDIHGDLDGLGDCALPQAIDAGDSYSCSFTVPVNGAPGDVETDTVTAGATDDDGNALSETGSASVTITDTPSAMRLSKTADPTELSEPGGPVTFSLVIDNDSAVDSITLDSLVDAPFGDVTALPGDCAVPQTIVAGGSYSCTFSAQVSGNAGDTVSDTVTASATDDDGNALSETAGASVDITDTPPTMVVTKSADPATIAEPGGPVQFSVSVENTSPEPITLSTLTDDVYGDLDGRGDCSLPQTIAVGDTYSCSAIGPVTGDAGDVREDIIEAIASDDDGNTITETAEAQVVITDVQPAIAVAKRATPSSVPEPGGPVSFTVQASNPSIEPVILESLVDDIHGDLDGQGTCQLPQTLTAGGGTYTCSFTAVVSGDVGDSETDTVTATGRDNEGNPAQATAQATVTITDVLPGIDLQKSAVPNSRPEPGGDYDIRISVVNQSAVEPVLLTSLDDDLLGDLDGQGDCAVPQTIAPAGSYQCTIPASLTGDAGTSETDTVTATASDNEGTEVVESDSATFSIIDRLPTFDLQKTASPTSVPEPGGDVTFTIEITNTSPEDLTLTDLFDDNYGDLSGQGTCSVPQTITPGATYTCAFTEYVANNAGETKIDIVAATLEDNEGNSTTLTDSASVTTTDTPPTFSVDKSLLYPARLDEPGGTAFYRLVITNTSLEPITLTALVDDPGSIDLDGRGSCSVPQTIAPGGTYACSFGVPVSGDGGDTVEDTVTVTGEDNDGTSVDVSDSAQIEIADVLPAIDVDKSADPTSVIAPGGDVTFTVVVTNDSVEDVTLDSLIDDPFGDITALPGDCAVPQVLAPADSYTCAFTVFVSGSLGELVRDTVTGSATDNEGNTATDSDGATVGVGGGGGSPGAVTIDKSASPTTLPEPGGDFTFTVTVSGEPSFSVLTLIDDVYGDLNGQGDCVLPQLAIASGTYTCSFPGAFSGDPGDSQTDVVGVTGTDASGSFVRFDSATVGISDILPALEVTKTATPNPIDEPGGAVTFGVEVTNTSLEASFLTLLTDDVYGDLDGRGDCVADGSAAIAPGATYTCSFSEVVTGNAGDVRTDLVLAQLSDDDGNDAFAIGRADVTIDDVLPSITLAKTPRPASVPEPGGTVSFGVVVTNTSIEPVEITSLSDDIYGDLDGQGSCVLPQTIAPGARYICSFPATVSGNAGDTATDVITASGTDDEGNPVVGTASASVPITESAPSLSISKVASPASLPEPGGSVSYTVTITNSSVSTDPVTVDSLSDSIEGAPGVVPADLACVSGGSDVSVPFTLASGASAVCTFGGSVSGNAGDSTSDTFTASGTDDEGAPARGSGSETVPITDVLPTMTVAKSSVPNPIPEPGGVVDYTATITNTSPETITLTVLNDDVAGPLSASCGLPVDIAVRRVLRLLMERLGVRRRRRRALQRRLRHGQRR